MPEKKYIGFFDSGIGGISVLAFALNSLPKENFIYFGDILHAPYGDKTAVSVHSFVDEAVQQMMQYSLKALVIACNTATAVAINDLRQRLSIPVLGIEPALKPAIEKTQGKILVMATVLTLKGDKFQFLLKKYGQNRDIILLPCPGLMELIEKNPNSEETKVYLQQLLLPYENQAAAIVLGCTHYAFAGPYIQQLMPHCLLFDGNKGVVKHLAAILKEQQLSSDGQGEVVWLSSLVNAQQKNEFQAKCCHYKDFYLDILNH